MGHNWEAIVKPYSRRRVGQPDNTHFGDRDGYSGSFSHRVLLEVMWFRTLPRILPSHPLPKTLFLSLEIKALMAYYWVPRYSGKGCSFFLD